MAQDHFSETGLPRGSGSPPPLKKCCSVATSTFCIVAAEICCAQTNPTKVGLPSNFVCGIWSCRIMTWEAPITLLKRWWTSTASWEPCFREMVLGHHFLRESEAAEPDRQRQVCSSVEKPCRLGGRWVTWGRYPVARKGDQFWPWVSLMIVDMLDGKRGRRLSSC